MLTSGWLLIEFNPRLKTVIHTTNLNLITWQLNSKYFSSLTFIKLTAVYYSNGTLGCL